MTWIAKWIVLQGGGRQFSCSFALLRINFVVSDFFLGLFDDSFGFS